MAKQRNTPKALLHQMQLGIIVMKGNQTLPPPGGGGIPPFVTDEAGWSDVLEDLSRFDCGDLIRRLDDFKALGVAATSTLEDADWRPSAAAAVLEHVKAVIEAHLGRNTKGDHRAFLTARSVAIGAIEDIESSRYDGLRSYFTQTLHHVTLDAERRERGPVLPARRFVGLASVAEMAVDSEEETIMSRDAILKAIQAESRLKRRIALALKYHGYTDEEIGRKVGVSAQRVHCYVRDFARSPLLAEFRDGLAARRRR